MTAPAKLAHVVLRTGRIDEMVEWYCTVLEAHAVFRNDFLAFVTYDDEHHRLAFVNNGATEAPSPRASGLEHIAFTYATLDDLLGTYTRLRGLGIAPAWCVNHGPTTSMYFADPDGNQVECQIDNFETAEDLRAWFRTGVFAKNPIGVEYDPEVLVARRAAGDSIEELVKQGSANHA